MRSYDIIGSGEKAVAIIELEKSEGKNEKKIAEEIMQKNKIVKSVLKKISARKGKTRTRDYKLIAGEKNTEVLHKEHGYLIKVDPQKVYFSPREATERQRIAEQVKAGEIILVMFSGVAVFPIAIAKKQPEIKKIFAIELNLDAHNYALENVRINKFSHRILPINADVKEVLPKIDIFFNRIIMPLPLESYKFLELAIKKLKKKGMIHLYFIGKEPHVFDEIENKLKREIPKLEKKFKILNKKIVLPYSPRTWKCVLDIYLY